MWKNWPKKFADLICAIIMLVVAHFVYPGDPTSGIALACAAGVLIVRDYGE